MTPSHPHRKVGSKAYAGFVYFVDSPELEDSLVKIGFTSESPEKRLRNLQNGSPVELRLLSYVGPVDKDFETELHARFIGSRVRGEWYAQTAELLSIVEAARG